MTPSELRAQGRAAFPDYRNPYVRAEDSRAYDEWEEGFAQAKWASVHIQDDCKYGYVLPDRCRYTRHLGCDCGAYPPAPL